MAKQSMWSAVKNAFEGIVYCVKTERNMKIHVLAAVLVGILAWRFSLNQQELLVLLLTVVIVLVTEMINTAMEAVVDLASPEVHPLAKLAKNISAGAVLLTALASLVVAYILFFSKLCG
jgi:diacylglycerol kinase